MVFSFKHIIHRCGLKSAFMNGQQDADFPKGRINSTLWKILILLSLLLCSCSSGFENNLLIGYWQVSHTTTKNPISILDDSSIEETFVLSHEAIEFIDKNTVNLVGKIGYSSKVCNYTLDDNYITITCNTERLNESVILEFKILNIDKDKLVLGQASEKLYNFSKVGFSKN